MSNTSGLSQRSKRSAWMVCFVTLVALSIGWIVKSIAENQTRPVSYKGISAEIPAGWLLHQQRNANQLNQGKSYDDPYLVFSTRDPLNPTTLYRLSLMPSSPDSSLLELATVRNLQRGKSLNIYRILEETPIIIGDQQGYKVTFAYVDPGEVGEAPTVITGADYYFTEDEGVIVATLELEGDQISRDLPQFLAFVQSISIEAGD